MRRLGLPTPYEQLKALTRGHAVGMKDLHGKFLHHTILPCRGCALRFSTSFDSRNPTVARCSTYYSLHTPLPIP